jgi:hypothetical protein
MGSQTIIKIKLEIRKAIMLECHTICIQLHKYSLIYIPTGYSAEAQNTRLVFYDMKRKTKGGERENISKNQ